MESSYEQPVLSIIHYQLTFMNHYQPTIHPRLNIMNYQPSLSNINSLLTNIHPLFTHYSRMISPPSQAPWLRLPGTRQRHAETPPREASPQPWQLPSARPRGEVLRQQRLAEEKVGGKFTGD